MMCLLRAAGVSCSRSWPVLVARPTKPFPSYTTVSNPQTPVNPSQSPNLNIKTEINPHKIYVASFLVDKSGIHSRLELNDWWNLWIFRSASHFQKINPVLMDGLVKRWFKLKIQLEIHVHKVDREWFRSSGSNCYHRSLQDRNWWLHHRSPSRPSPTLPAIGNCGELN